jgi:hypothetical protein
MKKYILRLKGLFVFTNNESGDTFTNSHFLAQKFTEDEAVVLRFESGFEYELMEV